MIKNIIFDCYGTLVDIKTKEDDNLFKKLGKKYNLDYLDIKNKFDFIKSNLEKESTEIDYLDIFKEIYPSDPVSFMRDFRKFSIKMVKTYRNVIDFLQVLNKEYDLYMLSNAQKVFIEEELKQLKIYDYFKDVIISSNLKIKKPQKDFFLHLINKYNLEPSETIMIGNDYNCDIIPAKSLGLNTIYLQTSLTPKEDKIHKGIKKFQAKKILNEINILNSK